MTVSDCVYLTQSPAVAGSAQSRRGTAGQHGWTEPERPVQGQGTRQQDRQGGSHVIEPADDYNNQKLCAALKALCGVLSRTWLVCARPEPSRP
jgi:hypothetical protein